MVASGTQSSSSYNGGRRGGFSLLKSKSIYQKTLLFLNAAGVVYFLCISCPNIILLFIAHASNSSN